MSLSHKETLIKAFPGGLAPQDRPQIEEFSSVLGEKIKALLQCGVNKITLTAGGASASEPKAAQRSR